MIEYLYSGAIGAGATIDMCLDATTGPSRQSRPTRPTRYLMAIVHESAAGDITFEVSTDQRVILGNSVMPCGGTDGVFPNLDQQAVKFELAQFEQLRIRCFDTTGAGGAIVMCTLMSEPLA